jgi:hypothetical protein
MSYPPKHLAHFPWATLGRAELPHEFWSKIAEQVPRAALFQPAPRFHLIVVEEEPGALASADVTWESLLCQSYPHWKATFVGEQSPFVGGASPDPRLVFQKMPPGTQPFAAKNLALSAIADEWVGVVGAGDVLSPAALYQFAWEIEKNPQSSGFYSFEAQMRANGKTLGDFIAKPSWDFWSLVHGRAHV